VVLYEEAAEACPSHPSGGYVDNTDVCPYKGRRKEVALVGFGGEK
jgi:hypothetical protein